MVHLDGLDFGGDTSWGEGDDHTGLDDTGLDSADWHCPDTRDLVDILERETEWLVGGSRRWVDSVNGLEKGLSGGLASLGLLLPTLVPWAVAGVVNHVVTVEARDWHEGDSLWVVSDLLDEVGCLLDDLVESVLGPFGGVHLVDSDNELLDTQGIGQESVLSGLTILGDTSLELTSTGSDNEDSAVSLGGTGNHVLDEVSVTWGVDDSDHVSWGLEFPEGNVDGDTSLSLGLQLVQNPGILEGTLAEFSSFLIVC